MGRQCAEEYGETCNKAREQLERLMVLDAITNTERLAVLKHRPDLLVEVDGIILRNRLHNALISMVEESVESGKVQAEKVEDLEILLYLMLLVAE